MLERGQRFRCGHLPPGPRHHWARTLITVNDAVCAERGVPVIAAGSDDVLPMTDVKKGPVASVSRHFHPALFEMGSATQATPASVQSLDPRERLHE